MSGLIGKKIGMTSVYSAEGKNIPCTVIEAGPCVVMVPLSSIVVEMTGKDKEEINELIQNAIEL